MDRTRAAESRNTPDSALSIREILAQQDLRPYRVSFLRPGTEWAPNPLRIAKGFLAVLSRDVKALLGPR
jgi:hypothetical protein